MIAGYRSRRLDLEVSLPGLCSQPSCTPPEPCHIEPIMKHQNLGFFSFKMQRSDHLAGQRGSQARGEVWALGCRYWPYCFMAVWLGR